MRVTLMVNDQFGKDGPLAGDHLDVFSFVYDEDGELWFDATWPQHIHMGYFILNPRHVRTDYQ